MEMEEDEEVEKGDLAGAPASPLVHPLSPPPGQIDTTPVSQPAQPPPQLYLLYIPTPNPRVSLSLSLRRKNRESSGITRNSTRVTAGIEIRARARARACMYMRVRVCFACRPSMRLFFSLSSENVSMLDE